MVKCGPLGRKIDECFKCFKGSTLQRPAWSFLDLLLPPEQWALTFASHIYIVFVQCNIRVTNEAQTLCMVIHNLDSLTGSILHSCSWSTMSHKQQYHCCGYHYPGAGSAGVSILHEECTWCQHFEKTVTAKHIVYSLLHHLQEKTVEYCGRNLFGLLWSAAHIYILLYTLHIFIL